MDEMQVDNDSGTATAAAAAEANATIEDTIYITSDMELEDIDLDEYDDEQLVTLGPAITRPESETVVPKPDGAVQSTADIGNELKADVIPLSSAKEEETKPEEVDIDGVTYVTVKEGLGKILVPKSAKDQKVFYNPIQQFNRDLTVAVLKGFGNLLSEEQAKKRQKNEGKRNHKKARNAARHEKKAATAATATDEEQQSKGDNGEAVEGAKDASIAAEAPAVAGAPKPGEQQPQAENSPGSPNNEQQPAKLRFRILDALSATGLRALRYAQELPFATDIVANDMSTEATAAIDRNIVYNNVSDRVTSSTANAIAYMYNAAFLLPAETTVRPQSSTNASQRKRKPQPNSNRFHVIDLDPFGTAVPFLDGAIQAVEDGGLLAVTCTDAGVFAATGYAEKCYSLYGGLPIKGDCCHEGGIRLILHAIGVTAAKYGCAIEPLLCLSIDYYVRVFVRVRRRPETVKLWASSNMMVYTCDDGCGSYRIQRLGTAKMREDKRKAPEGKDHKPGPPHAYKYGIARSEVGSSECEHCGTRMHIAGPMYSGALHSKEFLEQIISDVLPTLSSETYGTIRRMSGMLQTALSELTPFPSPPSGSEEPTSRHDLEPPHFFVLPTRLSKTLHCTAPSLPYLRSALLSLNHTAVRSHCRAGSIKTSAPWEVVWAIMRSWVKRHPIREDNIPKESVAWKILRRTPKVPEGSQADDVVMDDADVNVNAENKAEGDINEAEKETTNDKNKKPEEKKAEEDEEEKELIHGIIWDENLGREDNSGRGAHGKSGEKILRYQFNPANWGPMARPDKAKRNQNKSNKQNDTARAQNKFNKLNKDKVNRKKEKKQQRVNKKEFRNQQQEEKKAANSENEAEVAPEELIDGVSRKRKREPLSPGREVGGQGSGGTSAGAVENTMAAAANSNQNDAVENANESSAPAETVGA